MEYNDRKICGFINIHQTTPNLRCPLMKLEDFSCDGCQLFELYLKYKELSLKLKPKTIISEECKKKVSEAVQKKLGDLKL